MTDMLSTNLIRPFHALNEEGAKQRLESQNTATSIGEVRSLKALATELLQRQNPRNKSKATALAPASSYDTCETNKVGKSVKQTGVPNPSSLRDDFDERIAIAEYDGQQDALQAHRIAYEDAIMAILNANPPNDLVRPHVDWLEDRIKSAENYLRLQGIARPS